MFSTERRPSADRAPTERVRLIGFREVSSLRRRERLGAGALVPLARNDDAFRHARYTSEYRGTVRQRVSTNDDACAEIQPCDAKANYELYDAGDAPGASASSSRKMREDMFDSEVVFRSGSASQFSQML